MKAYAFKWIASVCVLLTCTQLAATYWLWQNPVSETRTAAESDSGSAVISTATEIEEPVAVEPTATFARPLFEPGRKPFLPKPPVPEPEAAEQPVVEPETVAVPEDADPSQLRLMGVLKTATLEQALIASNDNPSGDWFVPNAQVIGWKIKMIAPNSVTLEAHGKTFVLEHYQQADPQAVE